MLSFMALDTARSVSLRFMSRETSLDSDTELYIMALAARTCSGSISPAVSPSAMLADLSRSSMAILASP